MNKDMDTTKNELKERLKIAEMHKEGAMRELEKVQTQLYAAQDHVNELTDKLENKAHSERVLGWGIDRALETIRLRPTDANKQIDFHDITTMARKYCDWVAQSLPTTDTKPMQEVTPKETMQ